MTARVKLTPAMERALTCSHRGLVWAPRTSTVGALIRRGLATPEWRHTALGLAERDRIEQAKSDELVTPEILSDLCSLVMSDPPAASTIETWTTAEVIEVENWAALLHVAASDCIVVVPHRPSVLGPEKAATS